MTTTSTFIGAGLPTSRTDALSIVVLGFGSGFAGSTPEEGKKVALVSTVLANVWAIVSSILSLLDVVGEENDLESHLRVFAIALFGLTIVTSTVTLANFAVPGAIEYDTIDEPNETLLPSAAKTKRHPLKTFACKSLGVLYRLLFLGVAGLCLVQLVQAHTEGCEDPSFQDTALCDHETEVVIGVAVGVFVTVFILNAFVPLCSVGDPKGICQKSCGCVDKKESKKTHSEYGALFTRSGAIVKACLLGFYWFLVDADLSWDYTVKGHDMNLWVTGQWAKQGVAIANNFLNCLH